LFISCICHRRSKVFLTRHWPQASPDWIVIKTAPNVFYAISCPPNRVPVSEAVELLFHHIRPAAGLFTLPIPQHHPVVNKPIKVLPIACTPPLAHLSFHHHSNRLSPTPKLCHLDLGRIHYRPTAHLHLKRLSLRHFTRPCCVIPALISFQPLHFRSHIIVS